MKFYYMNMQADKSNIHELTSYKTALDDVKAFVTFGNHRAKFGLEVAMPLFKKIRFYWAKSNNPIGDMMSGSLFSTSAFKLIKQHRCELDICELVDIEGTEAYYISPKRVDELSDDLDWFRSRKYRQGIIVTCKFKEAWKAAGLLGAEFKPVY